MVVSIAGMHRSGTSMVTRVLNLAGLDLGPESELMPPLPENSEGFWENLRFVAINDDILSILGAGWDLPPTAAEGWERQPEMLPLRARALDLVASFQDREPWGWKDPRNCLTLPFWKVLLPGLKVCICVRNPLEVEQSLRRRNYFSGVMARKLWLEYNQRLLTATRPEDRVITHYDSYFHDCAGELRRVVNRLGMAVPEQRIQDACASASPALRHNRLTTADLLAAGVEKEVVRCYLDMCAEAGPIFQQVVNSESAVAVNADDDEYARYQAGLRMAQLEAQVAELNRQVARLQEEVQDKDLLVRIRDAELASITSGRCWRVLQLVRRLRLTAAPPGSFRERVLRLEPEQRKAG